MVLGAISFFSVVASGYAGIVYVGRRCSATSFIFSGGDMCLLPVWRALVC